MLSGAKHLIAAHNMEILRKAQDDRTKFSSSLNNLCGKFICSIIPSMELNIIGKNLDLTPSIKAFAEKKLLPLAKFLKRFEEEGSVSVRLELARITQHHRRGNVFWAAADLKLPGKLLRAETEAGDARAAIDGIKDELRIEIEKYKTKFLKPQRGAGK